MGEFRAYGGLLGMACLTILSGAHASLRMPKEAKMRLRAHHGVKQSKADEDEEQEDEEIIERLTRGDALAFPILGSCVLFALYLAFQYLSKVWINRIIGGYMSIMGIAATARMLVSATKLCVKERSWRGMTMWKLSLHKNKSEYGSASANVVHVLAILLAVFLAISQQCRPHWIVANLLALAFAFNAISLLRLDSFFTGSALLALLFVYDIWWVFGSKAVFGADVMVKVATNLDAPIKVTFPRDLAASTGFSLLGLDDIVLPGIFIALALRYDYHRALRATPPPLPSSAFPKPYFLSSFLAYITGLGVTIFVMHTFRAAQPALLYLSPACISSVILCAIARGELSGLWAFDDSSDDDDERSDKKGKEGEVSGEAGGERKKVEKAEDSEGNGKKMEKKEERESIEEEDIAESTSVEVEGQRVLRSRVIKQ